jgi:hypothetical protein
MQKTKFRAGKIASVATAAIMMVSSLGINAFAATTSELETGTYEVDSTLSCLVNAMGGIEFANDELYKGATVTVNDDGQASATLEFSRGYGDFSIYGVAVNHFIDASNSTPGYYDENGELVKLTKGEGYTLSEDTIANSKGEEVNYVTEITFPVSVNTSDYTLYLYVNSNIMGCQFCDGSGSAGSNTPDALTPYKASLNIDWSTASKVKTADKTSSQSATVKYVVDKVDGGDDGNKSDKYVVNIPAVVNVDAETKTGSYSVEAEEFSLSEGAYVNVSTNSGGTLSNGTDTVPFTNELESESLTKTGDSLNGTVKVTGDAASAGEYAGTIDFTIDYFAN